MQSQQEKAQAQPEVAETPEISARSAPDVAKIRRRAILVALVTLFLLLLVGLGESFGGFLPHQTPAFANGTTQQAGNFQVTLQFTPNPPKISGDPKTQIAILLQGRNGQQIDGARVQVSLAMVTMDMGQSDYLAQGQGQGRYQTNVAFVMVGEWQVTVTITPPGGTPVTTTFTVDVAA